MLGGYQLWQSQIDKKLTFPICLGRTFKERERGGVTARKYNEKEGVRLWKDYHIQPI